MANWPEDTAHAARLLVIGLGQMKPIRRIRFVLVDPSLFGIGESTAPHNAYQDTSALRSRPRDHERRTGM